MSNNDVLLRLSEIETEMYTISAHLNKSAEELGVALTIQDTDFLIRTLNETPVKGADANTLTALLTKLSVIHKVLMEKGVAV